MIAREPVQSYEKTVFPDRRRRSGCGLSVCIRYAADADRLEPGCDRGKQRQLALHERGSTV